MKKFYKIDPIALRDKYDLLKADEILNRIGIKVFGSEEKKKEFENGHDDIKDNFLISEDDGGWRIQSHYLGFGITIDSLEEQVNNIINKIPNIIERTEELKKMEDDLESFKKKMEIEIEEFKKKNLTFQNEKINHIEKTINDIGEIVIKEK
jgi:hypothetical protein